MISSLALLALVPSFLIGNAMVIDGTGKPAFSADVRIEGERIVAVGQLEPIAGEQVIDARGLTLAPGFIDAHSHADGNLDKLESQLRQGITTAICGQDGGRPASVREQKEKTKQAPIRFEFFSGHGGLREAAMKSLSRKAAPFEIRRMEALLEEDMKAGALGLSTGLEYDPGHYSSTEELIALSKKAERHGGMYISHVRDESHEMLESVREVLRIGREARLPAQISHIKMGVASVWGKSAEVIRMVEKARAAGQAVTADVYPYLYWQSTIRVLTVSRDYGNRKVWESALADVGGAKNVRLTSYSPNSTWVGKTLEQLSKETGKDAPSLIIEIVNATAEGKGRESVLVSAMTEEDLTAFVRQPWIMFSSDGSGGGSHPRSAGSFPRVLARYVRDLKVISLEEAIRKMTSLPARTFKLHDRGVVKPGMSADLVLFDAKTIRDTATPENPTSMAVGVKSVFVRGTKQL
ncbi:MAG: amidohydrolase family protein [Fimbriimonas sp.]